MSTRISISVLIIALTVGATARAEPQLLEPYPFSQASMAGPPPGTDLQAYYKAAQSKRMIGIILTAAGVAAFGAGTIVLLSDRDCTYIDCLGPTERSPDRKQPICRWRSQHGGSVAESGLTLM